MTRSIIFKDVYFSREKYFVSDNGEITTQENSTLPIVVIHSSNGFDYVLLKTSSSRGKCIYPIDEIVAFTFKRSEVLKNTRYDQSGNPHFTIKHKDGNNRNNAIDNLEVLPSSLETWVELSKPKIVVEGMYEISSFGRVKNVISNKILKTCMTNGDGYPVVGITCNTDDGLVIKTMKLHRLLALHFVQNPDPEKLNVVNHIDGNKTNFDIKNLQWVSSGENSKFASQSNLNNRSNITTQDIDTIVSLLIELNGSIKDVYSACKQMHMSSFITEAVINNIKHKDPAYIRIDSGYDLKNIEFKKRVRKADLTADDIHKICQQIVANNGDIGKTLQSLHDMGMEHIARHDVRHVRDKSKHSNISDQYFKRDDFDRPRAPLPDDMVERISVILADCGGSIAKTLKMMHAQGFDIVTKYDVQDIKYKKRRRDISDRYFTFDDKEFKLI